jgi:HAD superfamily hydrolase (TIGR01450 family)
MGQTWPVLKATEGPLWDDYDLAVLDLDGVVYVGPRAVPHAPEALTDARRAGMHVAFVTNNAARPPETVAEHLTELGVQAAAGDVVTSAQAAARLAARALPAGSKVFVIGGDGLEQALRERDLVPVTEPADDIAAVAQGYGPDMPWRQVIDGAILVREGLPWFVSNTDLTVPTAHGVGPGNGTLVKLVAEFADRQPAAAGKPEPPLFEETKDRVGGERPLVVGDRLDTDIEGAVRVGWDSLLVLTGVTGLADLVRADARLRPTFIGADLRALGQAQPVPEVSDARWHLNGWTASVEGGHLRTEGTGEVADWWRVVASAAWSHLDRVGTPVDADGLRPPE